MKPTKMRNRLVYRASYNTRSKQLTCHLSKDLRNKHGKKRNRVMVGDTIKVIRGEYTGVDAKVTKIFADQGTVSIEGVKKEKSKGEKVDIAIHVSNLLITNLNDEGKRKITKSDDTKTIIPSQELGVDEDRLVDDAGLETEAKDEQEHEMGVDEDRLVDDADKISKDSKEEKKEEEQ